MPEYRKEWMEKSSIDYFSPFISLWLACNSWYQWHYSEINGSDRDFINMIKADISTRNHLFTKFDDLLEKESREGIAFRTDIELLHYALERIDLRPDKIDTCSFRYAVVDYRNKNRTEDLIKTPRIRKDGSVRTQDAPDVIKLDQIYITSDKTKFFAGLFENHLSS